MLSRVNKENAGRTTNAGNSEWGKETATPGGGANHEPGTQNPRSPCKDTAWRSSKRLQTKSFNQRDAVAPPPLKDELLLFLYVIRLYLLAMREFLFKTTDCENQNHQS